MPPQGTQSEGKLGLSFAKVLPLTSFRLWSTNRTIQILELNPIASFQPNNLTSNFLESCMKSYYWKVPI